MVSVIPIFRFNILKSKLVEYETRHYIYIEYIHRHNSAHRTKKGQCSITKPPLTPTPPPLLVMYDWLVCQNHIVEISIKLTAYVRLPSKRVTPRHQILLFKGAVHHEKQQSGHIITNNAILFLRARFARTYSLRVIISKTKHELYGSKTEKTIKEQNCLHK